MNYGTKLKVADLFAGAGGFSLGAIDAGCDVVFAVELNPNAALTYKNNIGKPSRAENVVVYNNDITKLDPAVLARKHFAEIECDLLLGGRRAKASRAIASRMLELRIPATPLSMSTSDLSGPCVHVRS